MIAEIQSRMFRPHAVTVSMRQHVASRGGAAMSKRMAKVVAVIICVSLLVVIAFSEVMHWHIVASANQLEELRSVSRDSRSRNIALLATRAQLASQKFVEERAREKFQLMVPQGNQIRRL